MLNKTINNQTHRAVILMASSMLLMIASAMTALAINQQQINSNSNLNSNSFSNLKLNNTKSQLYNLFIDDCIKTHNEHRRKHGVAELKPSKKLTKFARRRAKHIAASDGAEFRHPDDLIYGENLAWHSDSDRTCAQLIKLWYDERDLYNFRLGKFNTDTGHFTQLVWKTTTRVGCAKAYGVGPRGGVYLVCNYDPPGNWVGEALENVFDITSFSSFNSNSLSTSINTNTNTMANTNRNININLNVNGNSARAIPPPPPVSPVGTYNGPIYNGPTPANSPAAVPPVVGVTKPTLSTPSSIISTSTVRPPMIYSSTTHGPNLRTLMTANKQKNKKNKNKNNNNSNSIINGNNNNKKLLNTSIVTPMSSSTVAPVIPIGARSGA